MGFLLQAFHLTPLAQPALTHGAVPGSYLVPRIRSVSRVDQNSNDFGSRQQGCTTFRYHLCVKVIGTLLKHEVCAGIGGDGKEFHVPAKQTGRWWAAWPDKEMAHDTMCLHLFNTHSSQNNCTCQLRNEWANRRRASKGKDLDRGGGAQHRKLEIIKGWESVLLRVFLGQWNEKAEGRVLAAGSTRIEVLSHE